MSQAIKVLLNMSQLLLLETDGSYKTIVRIWIHIMCHGILLVSGRHS